MAGRSFNEYDKIRLIDSPNEQTKQAFIQAVRTWPRGIQDEKEKEPQCFQMKLRGHPWITSDGTEVNAARMLACNILSAMDHQGFELVGSVDMSIDTSGNSRDRECCRVSDLPQTRTLTSISRHLVLRSQIGLEPLARGRFWRKNDNTRTVR